MRSVDLRRMREELENAIEQLSNVNYDGTAAGMEDVAVRIGRAKGILRMQIEKLPGAAANAHRRGAKV
jgi:hypothetical protein